MAKKLTKAHMGITLYDVVEQTIDGPGFLHTPAQLHEEWLSQGYVEINSDAVDEYGCIATRATQKGIDLLTFNENENETDEEFSLDIEIEDNIGLPARASRRAKPEVYPFSKLEVGQSFLLPEGVALDDAKKHVMRANRKYVEAVAGETRVTRHGREVPVTKATRNFTAREVDGRVRVWRMK